jgi:hypothetical protein
MCLGIWIKGLPPPTSPKNKKMFLGEGNTPPPNLPQILKSGFGGGELISLSRLLQKKSVFLGEVYSVLPPPASPKNKEHVFRGGVLKNYAFLPH